MLESELGLLLATYKASEGVKSRSQSKMTGSLQNCVDEELLKALELSKERRRSTENIARHLVSRLEKELNLTDKLLAVDR